MDQPSPIAGGRRTRLESVVFSTDHVDEPLRFEAWRSWFLGVNDVVVPRESETTFAARSEQWRIGSFLLGVNSTPARRLVRAREHCRRDEVDHWAVRLSLNGRGALQSNGRAFLSAPGSIGIDSFADPCVADLSAGDWIALIFPRDAHPRLTARMERLGRNAWLPDATGSLLADYLASLALRVREANVDQATALADMTLAMLEGCLPNAGGTASEMEDAGDVVRRAAVERVIRRHLGSARLDVDRLCALSGVPRSSLYRLYEREGGVAAHIRRLRLQKVDEDLRNPALATVPIAALAERRGFHCAAAFSRSYRNAYGRSPREAREAPVREDRRRPTTELPLAPMRPRPAGVPGPSLVDLLP